MPRSPVARALLIAALGGVATARADEPPRFEFTRLVAHWDRYGDPDYLKFIDEARPDVAQVGFYGAHFWSLGHTPQYDGYPAHFPVRGLDELGDWFEDLNGKLHAAGVKVVGHFNVEFLVGDPDGPDGPRASSSSTATSGTRRRSGRGRSPTRSSLLEKDADGSPIKARTYAIGGMNEYWACLRNPAWQAVLKAWVRQGVRRGLDGFIDQLFLPAQLPLRALPVRRSGPTSASGSRPRSCDRGSASPTSATHRFREIVSWHPAAETTPLRLEMLRFSQVSNKEVFDEVFVRYGRSLKPDLIVAQWNHLGNLSQIDGDERCLLPAGALGPGRDRISGTAPAARRTTPTSRTASSARPRLQARYIRGAFDDKPFTLGKYEGTRIRSAIAELAANGGAPMGFYTRFTDPAGPRRDRPLLPVPPPPRRRSTAATGPTPRSPCCSPGAQVHRGDVAAVEPFRKIGQALLDAHVLFDVWPDDPFPAGRAARYAQVVTVATPRDGRRRPPRPPEPVRGPGDRPGLRQPAGRLGGGDRPPFRELRPRPSRRPAPTGSRARARGSRTRSRWPSPGSSPTSALPAGAALRSVRFLTPEQDGRAGPRRRRSRTAGSGSPSRSSSSMAWPGSNYRPAR